MSKCHSSGAPAVWLRQLVTMAVLWVGTVSWTLQAQTVDISLLSSAVQGDTAAASSEGHSLGTPDGRYSVFSSFAPNLVTGQVDSNNEQDVFLFDRANDTTMLVSRALDATAATPNNRSRAIAISVDGSQVLFASFATNVVAGVTDSNSAEDTFLFDRASGTTILVSHASAVTTETANGISSPVAISADGNKVMFSSRANNLVTGVTDTNGTDDAFLFDRISGATTLIASALGAATVTPFGGSFPVAISADGNRLVFESQANHIIAGMTDSNSSPDIFLFDRVSGITTLVSRAMGSANTTANNDSDPLAISADGSYVLFSSLATDVLAGVNDSNGESDVFLFECATGTTMLVTRALGATTATANGGSYLAKTSSDGNKVMFGSRATNLVVGATDENFGTSDVFLFDRTTGVTILVSRALGSATATANGFSVPTALSADGSQLVFTSEATNVVPGVTDNNADFGAPLPYLPRNDVFLFDVATTTNTLVSHSRTATLTTSENASNSDAISADGNQIMFRSRSTDLIAGVVDTNATGDVFLFNRASGTTILISRARGAATATAAGFSRGYAMNEDGGSVLLSSSATNLVPGVTENNRGGADVFLFDRPSGTKTLISRAAGMPMSTANDQSYPSSWGLSGGGNLIAFGSYSNDLIAGLTDNNGSESDVFLFDRIADTTILVSRALEAPTKTPNSESFPGAISADGRHVMFASTATNLVPGVTDNAGSYDAFSFDRVSGTTTLISRALGVPTVTANSNSFPHSISADGNLILFNSFATNVVAGVTDNNGDRGDVFLFDRASGTTTLISRALGSASSTAGGNSAAVAMNAEGSQVLFRSDASNIVAGVSDSNAADDVFLFDRVSNTTTLVSRALGVASATPNRGSWPSSMTDDGRYVLFQSQATDVVAGLTDTNGSLADVFLFDRSNGTTTLVSRALGDATVTANNTSYTGTLRADGGQVLFASAATNLVAGAPDSDDNFDVFLFDRASSQTILISRGRGPPRGMTIQDSYPVEISTNGNHVFFESYSDNIESVDVDRNDASDVFLAEVHTLDYGDAPTSYGTLLADDGARHRATGSLLLGVVRDSEFDAAIPRDGLGDDAIGDDEDGVGTIQPLVRGSTLNLEVTASGTGVLNAFADWNRDGDFDLPTEQVATDLAVTSGPNMLTMTPPFGAGVGTSILRLRVSTATGLGPNGSASDGEVEDHPLSIAINSHTVTATASGNGSITPPSQNVNHGAVATFVVAPDANHHVVNVTGSTCTPIDQGSGSWTASSITAPCAVTASFNRNPIATDGALTVAEDSGTTPGALNANDDDPLTFQILSNPAKGSLLLTDANTGAYTYTPAANANGSDIFTFKATGGGLDSNTATVTISIAPVNDAPSLGFTTIAPHPAGSSGPQLVTNFASFDAGPTDEDATQTVDDFLIDAITDPAGILAASSVDITNDGALSYALTGVGGSATIQARVRDTGAGSGSDQNTSVSQSFTISVGAGADLQVTKDNGQIGLLDGATTVYVIVVTNAGPNTATGANLTDALPSTLINGSWSCNPAMSTATCPVPGAGNGKLDVNLDLAVNQVLHFHVMAQVNGAGAGSVINTAEVTLPAGLVTINPGNDTATDQDPILPFGIFGSGFEGMSTPPLVTRNANKATVSD